MSDAHNVEQRIRESVQTIRNAWLDLARDLHVFHGEELWRDLGHDSFECWLESPGIDIGRRWTFLLIALWQTFVVDAAVEPDRLRGLSPAKLQETVPVVRRCHVTADQAIQDAARLTRSELRERYHGCDDERPRAIPRRFETLSLDELAERYANRVGPVGREMVGVAVRRLASASGRRDTREALLNVALEAVAWADQLSVDREPSVSEIVALAA